MQAFKLEGGQWELSLEPPVCGRAALPQGSTGVPVLSSEGHSCVQGRLYTWVPETERTLVCKIY